MVKKLYTIWIYALMFFCLLIACVTTQNISNKFMENDLNTIHPSFKIYHGNELLSTFFYQFKSSELLYTRLNKNSLFQSKIKLTYSVFEEGNKTAVDTGSLMVVDKVENVKHDVINGFFEFNFPLQKKGYIKLEVRDENRGRSIKEYSYLDKLNDYNKQFFLIKDSLKNIVYNDFMSNEKEVEIHSYFNIQKSLYASRNNTYYSLAQPPFSKSVTPSFKFKTSNAKKLSKNQNLSFNYTLPQFGLTYFQVDTSTKSGFTLFQFQDYYPRVKTAQEMIKPVRYICTKEEFEKLQNRTDSKQAIDEFWLAKGNTLDISRDLIKKYYSRVEKANLYFTSHKEGWKTDRGMISIIFGPPKLVRKTTNAIVWIYGDENNMNSITFTFERINNPFSNNDYQLIRNYNYKNSWYRAVDAWRNGKAYWIQ